MGNTCGTGSSSATLDQLKNIPLGGTYQFSSGCGPSISGTQPGSGFARLTQRGMGWPQNGEFEWGGLGDSCQMCSDPVNGYGCEGCSGAGAVGGNRGTVKRSAYKGDQTACCTQQPSGGLLNGNTCDPQYSSSNYSNKQCDQPMQTFCAQGTNIVTDPNCVTWKNIVGNGNSYVEAAMKSYCAAGDNITSATCENWLNVNQTSEQAWYDQQSATYCALHPELTTGFCGCFNLPAGMVKGNLSALAMKPSCYVQSCSPGTGAYRTANMQADAKTCAPINICNQTINATMTNAEIAALNQTCNIYAEAYAAASAVAKSSATSSSTSSATGAVTTSSSSSTSQTELIVTIVTIVGFVCLCSSLGATMYVRKE